VPANGAEIGVPASVALYCNDQSCRLPGVDNPSQRRKSRAVRKRQDMRSRPVRAMEEEDLVAA
jgi:hypothetical protein